jgi:RND family efflux transporter MFP subunit
VITAAESVDIAPRFQGVVASVNVRPGDVVQADQVVAEMDRKSMEEELRAAQAAYGATAAAARQAEVDVEDARRKLTLETKAVAEGISPRSALDEARLAVKRAQAAAQKARSAVAQEGSYVQTARDHLADLALRAPADGTVALRFKDPGSTVPAGTPIVRIVGHGGLRMKFAVPPEHAHKLSPGSTVQATVDTVTSPVTATIRQVSPALDPSSGLIIVEAELAGDSSSDLRPGLAAWVK